MRRIPPAALLLCLCAAARAADTVDAVAIDGKGVLTMCRDWIVYRSCKPYDKIALPQRVAVGDRVRLTFGSNPKNYVFHVTQIRPKGDGCIILSEASGGAEDRERIEVACRPIPEQPAPKQSAGGG
jgi:hypothetical protein